MKIFDSVESYASAMRQIGEFRAEAALAELGQPRRDYIQRLEAVQELQKAAVSQRAQGNISTRFLEAHKELEKALEEVSLRVDRAVSLPGTAPSGPKQAKGQKDWPWRKRAIGGAVLAALLALSCFRKDFPARNQTGSSASSPPPPPTAPAGGVGQAAGSTPASDLNGETGVLLLPPPGDGHFWVGRELVLSPHSSPEPQSDPGSQIPKQIFGIQPNEGGMNVLALLKEAALADSRQAALEQVHTASSSLDSLTLNGQVGSESKVAAAVHNLVVLGSLAFAGDGLRGAYPLFGCIIANRMYKMSQLSNSTLLETYSPEAAQYVKTAAQAFDQVESSMPISVNQLLKNMNSLDRWAAVGLLKRLPNIPGIGGMNLGAANVVLKYSWPVLQYAPFFVDAVNVKAPSASQPANSTSVAGMSSPIQDVTAAVYYLLAGQALTGALPFLTLSATHQVYTILRESEQTEELKKTLPLFSGLIEKSSQVYEAIESCLPFSTTNMLSGLTQIDRWAMIGLMNLLRPGFLRFGGRVPPLAFILSDAVWRFAKFTPLLVGSGLSKVNEAIGFNPSRID